jgi:hypothetical protein
MTSESGDKKLLGNFRKLIDHVSAEANYKPANDDLKPPALEAQYTAAASAVEGISTKTAPYKAALNDRQSAYEALGPIVVRARNMLKALGADQRTLDNAETYVRKLLGRRKSAKPNADPKATKDDSGTPANEAGASHSASQLSFDNRLGHFESFVAVLANFAGYNPNEDDLKVASLQALANDLKAKNNAVNATFVPLSQSRGARDQLLYGNADCVVNRALLVKAYVNAAFGSSSQLNKQIKGLEFKRSRK